jgi:lactoylglutathione lyase
MQVIRAGAIIAVSDLEKSLHFYRDQLGMTVDALYDDPPYATLVCAGARISLAQQGFSAPDRPGVVMTVPADPGLASVVLALQVDNADAARELLGAREVTFLGPSSYPPWGGSRFFCVDPDGYLVEVESGALPGTAGQPAELTRELRLRVGARVAGLRVLDGKSVPRGRKGVISDSISSAWHRFSVWVGLTRARGAAAERSPSRA